VTTAKDWEGKNSMAQRKKKKKVIRRTKAKTKTKTPKKKTTKKGKKKTTKKKTVKKKTVVRKSGKKSGKKKARKKTRKVVQKLNMEDIYKLINKAQLEDKKSVFAVESEEASMVENILKDCEVRFDIIPLVTKTKFVMHPSYRDPVPDELDVNPMMDEILEDGQIFL